MITLHHVKLTKDQLDAIPEAERNLVILLCHAANELSVLSKLFHFSAKQDTDVPLLVEAQNAQALVLGRLLTGKIYECWKLLKASFFGAKVSRTYVPLFDEDSKNALDNFKQYFGGDNLIKTVRNEFAFHYSAKQIAAGYEKVGDNDSLDAYLSLTNANTLYSFAESVTGRSLMESINPEDHSLAIDSLIRETSQVIAWLNEFIGGCVTICLNLYIGSDLCALGATEINIEGAVDLKSVSIPYFVEIVEDEPRDA